MRPSPQTIKIPDQPQQTVSNEVQVIAELDHLLSYLDDDQRRRVLTWAWDRYVTQVERDAFKPQMAPCPPA